MAFRRKKYLLYIVGIILLILLIYTLQSKITLTGFSILGGEEKAGVLNGNEQEPNIKIPTNTPPENKKNQNRSEGLFVHINNSSNSSNTTTKTGGSSNGNGGSSRSNGGGRRLGGPPSWTPQYGRFKGGLNPIWENFPDPSHICGGQAVLQLPGIGLIRWTGCVDARYANFDRDVEIKQHTISVDSHHMNPSFNSSAEIIMEGINLSYVPAIYRNGEFCKEPFCQIKSYTGGQFIFTVSSFSSYTLGPNTKLDIWDETDLGKPYAGTQKYIGETVLFYANYTNISDATPITGATCTINYTDTGAVMTYNTTKQLYEYNRSFTNAGFYEYNITCEATEFATLNTTDYTSIQTPYTNLTNTGPNGANVTAGESSRANPDVPEYIAAQSGNSTPLYIDGGSITQSWQGYYGNVTGIIHLSDGQKNMLYNWNENSPAGEVYASRSSSVNFANISCANTVEILNEENSLGQETTDTDSITNTFNQSSHPQLFVGITHIGENNCSSTNLFDNGGIQNSLFYELLLSDNSGMLIYTSLLEEDTQGFNSATHDFEMIVGENGHETDTTTTPYYFYTELN